MPEGKKHVIVDGESLLFMRWALNISEIYFRALATLLRGVGHCQTLAGPPVCILNSNRGSSGRLQRAIRQAGFSLLAATSFDEKDDLLVKKEIHRCWHWPGVSEVVLVSSDGGIIEELYRLRTAMPHVHVIVVATLAEDPRNGACSISRDIVRMIQCNMLGFVDLSKYASRIGSQTLA